MKYPVAEAVLKHHRERVAAIIEHIRDNPLNLMIPILIDEEIQFLSNMCNYYYKLHTNFNGKNSFFRHINDVELFEREDFDNQYIYNSLTL